MAATPGIHLPLSAQEVLQADLIHGSLNEPIDGHPEGPYGTVRVMYADSSMTGMRFAEGVC